MIPRSDPFIADDHAGECPSSPPGDLLSDARALNAWANHLNTLSSRAEAGHQAQAVISGIRQTDHDSAAALDAQLLLLATDDLNGIRRWARSTARIAASAYLRNHPEQMPLERLVDIVPSRTQTDASLFDASLTRNERTIHERLAQGGNILVQGRDLRYDPFSDAFTLRWVPNLDAAAASRDLVVEAPPPRVVISVLVWNAWEDIQALLPSLARIDTPNVELVVLDNGSDECRFNALVAWYRHTTPPFALTLMRSDTNLGFDEGHNVIVDYALHGAGAADYVFFLNDDTRVAPDFLSRALEIARAECDIGAVGSKVFSWRDDRSDVDAGDDTVQFSGDTHWLSPCPSYSTTSESTAETGWVHGAAMLVPRIVLERVGAWDPRLFAYMEEHDLALRMQNAGFRAVVALRSHIWHRDAGPPGFYRPPGVHMNVRNSLLLLRKHGRTRSLPDLHRTMHQIGWFVRMSWAHAWSQREPAYLWAPLQGILDGLAGRSSAVRYDGVEVVFSAREAPQARPGDFGHLPTPSHGDPLRC